MEDGLLVVHVTWNYPRLALAPPRKDSSDEICRHLRRYAVTTKHYPNRKKKMAKEPSGSVFDYSAAWKSDSNQTGYRPRGENLVVLLLSMQRDSGGLEPSEFWLTAQLKGGLKQQFSQVS